MRINSRDLRALCRFKRLFRTFNSEQPVPHASGSSVLTQQQAAYIPHKLNIKTIQCTRHLATVNAGAPEALVESPLDHVAYERVCTETLDTLCDYFEELTENASHITNSDVAYSGGVLTVKLGNEYGTYVINRQTPNKQIWLSSPISGPKRYDFVGPKTAETGKWIYKHTGESIHELLQREMTKILKEQSINFLQLPYSS